VGFIPFEHEAPDEKDELFSEIFSEERSERRNKEKDRKKWQKQAGESNSFVLAIFDWLEVVVLSAAFALILFTFVMRMAVVDGNSMNHTLHDKEVLIISDLMYTPDNGDIIVFSSPNYPEPIVKRVIATEGQVVDIDFETWTVTVDGKKVSEEYVNRVPGSMNRSDMEFPLTVPEGKVFVMGDNRNDSLDSRNSRIGFVDERYILGEVKIRLFPIDRFGTVD
jgi:signal peptidase I